MNKQVTLTVEEAQRYAVIERLDQGEITTYQAAQLVGRSERQVRRMLAACRQGGPEAMAHGNRGRTPHNAIGETIRAEVLRLSASVYAGLNDRHLRDMLDANHGISLSPASVRRIRRQAGIEPNVRRRPPKKHRRRERMPREGMLIQIDASPFHWMGDDHPRASLVLAIDDATNEIAGLFRPTEDCFGYLDLLHKIIRKKGIPQALYFDGSSIFLPHKTKRDDELPTSQRKKSTHFSRMTEALGIRLIKARSPQAKGRVERAFRTLQDRLAKELQLHTITSIDQANEFLATFVETHNKRFACQPRETQAAWTRGPAKKQLDDVIAFTFRRVAKPDHTVSFCGSTLDLPKNLPATMAKKTIQIRVHLDGRITFWHDSQKLGDGPTLKGEPSPDRKQLKKLLLEAIPKKQTPATKIKPVATSQQRNWAKPAPDHPWRRTNLRAETKRPVIPSAASVGG
jgi:transposase